MRHGLLEAIRFNVDYQETAKWTAIDGSTEADLYPLVISRNLRRRAIPWGVGGEVAVGTNQRCRAPMGSTCATIKNDYGAMHFGIGHGADRHQMNSKLRLEGIVDRVTVVVDDKVVVCDKGQIKV